MERGQPTAGGQEGLALERSVFFRDAVLAIELRLPELHDGVAEALPGALRGLWPRSPGSLVSFLVIG